MKVIEIKRGPNGNLSNYDEVVVVLEEEAGTRANAAIETLLSPAAKQLALDEAAKQGIRSPAITIGLQHPWPVDEKGQAITQVGVGAPTVVAYRVNIPIASRF